MFCFMDVSGSMTEHMKDFAKRFYMLLYVFLKRRYRHVEIVFVRHTHEAKGSGRGDVFQQPRDWRHAGLLRPRGDETDRRRKILPASWNIYAAQASDGDNSTADRATCTTLLRDAILPLCQYFAYLEVGADDEGQRIGFATHSNDTVADRTRRLVRPDSEIAMRKVNHRREIYPVFRDLFRRRSEPLEQGSS